MTDQPQDEVIYDDDSLSLLSDVGRWLQAMKKPGAKVDYKTDLQANLVPLILQMFQVLSARITETEKIVVEQLEENTLQPAFAERLFDVFALAEAAFKSGLVSTEDEAVKKFRAAVAEITVEINDSIIDVEDEDEDEEVTGEIEPDGEPAEEEAVV